MIKPFLTKEAPTDLPKAGDRQAFDVKFRPVSDDELKKMFGDEDKPEGYVAGFASTDDLDHYKHIVEPNAFAASIAEKGLEGPMGIKLLIQHDSNRPAGRILKLEQTPQGLRIEAQMNLNISYVRDMYEAAKMQGGLSFSVGFFLEDFEEVYEDGNFQYLRIKQGELTEVSIVTFPGNDAAKMTFIKDRAPWVGHENMADLEKALVAANILPTRNAANSLVKSIRDLIQPATPTEKPLSASESKSVSNISETLKKMALELQKLDKE